MTGERNAIEQLKIERPHKVGDTIANLKLNQEQRMSNLEHDIVLNTGVLYEVLEQNNKYADYLGKLIKREEQSIAFWSDIRTKLASASILGAFGILGTVLWYGLNSYLKSI